MQIPKTSGVMRSWGTGALVAGGIGTAAVAGFVGAHAATNRGDYKDPGPWAASAVVTGVATAAVGITAAVKGSRMVASTLGDVPRLFTEMEAASLATSAATGAKKTHAASRLSDAHAAAKNHVDSNKRRMTGGVALLGGAAALAAGSSAAMMLTNARLNPGFLRLEITADFELREQTEAKKLQNEVADAGELAKDTADGLGGWVRDVIPGGD